MAEVLPVLPVETVTATTEDTTSTTLAPTITATRIPPFEAAVVSSAASSSVVVSVPHQSDVVVMKDTTTIPADAAMTTMASKAVVPSEEAGASALWPLVVDTDTQEKKEEVTKTKLESPLPIEDIFQLKDISNEVEVRYSPQALGASSSSKSEAGAVAAAAEVVPSTLPQQFGSRSTACPDVVFGLSLTLQPTSVRQPTDGFPS